MANTYTLIASSTVGSGGAATIDFTSIPATFTDLCLVISARNSAGIVGSYIKFNSSTSGYSSIGLEGTGSGGGDSFSNSGGTDKAYVGVVNWSSSTSNTFTSYQIYIPSYTSSNYKSFSVDQVTENNATLSWATLVADLWSNTSAIDAISFFPASGTIQQHSTAYLYGISNS